MQLQQVLGGNLFGGAPKKRRRIKVPCGARDLQPPRRPASSIDMERVRELAVARVEAVGHRIHRRDRQGGRYLGFPRAEAPQTSRGQGVQRDLLPDRRGLDRPDPARAGADRPRASSSRQGAFHVAKPSDLIPELQGRFPIRVELQSLTEADFVRILKEPRNSLVRQYTALLATESVELDFTDEGVAALAEIAAQVNERTDDIGARRLHTILERLLDEVSFDAPDQAGTSLRIDRAFVEERLSGLVQDEDLSRYIL